MDNLTFQHDLRPAIPNIYGTADYREFRDTLTKINDTLEKTGLENELVIQALKKFIKEKGIDSVKFCNTKSAGFHYKNLRYALRCNIARHLSGDSYRKFSIRLADSTLFQWFTGITIFSQRKAVSKNTLERYEKYFDEKVVMNTLNEYLAKLSNLAEASKIGLNSSIEFSDVFIDSTCVKANIHFPVDWVLLRDAARSLLLAIETIRRQGLKHRMIAPSELLKQMNRLCIEMTHTRRKKDSKKNRKEVLRKMKKLSNQIRKHAKRYRKMLLENLSKTNWSEAQARQVIGRIDNILSQLPAAIKQAHERIIGERQLKAKDKILSFYDAEAQMLIRCKSGAEFEFGQKLLLAEQKDGLIIDCELFEKNASSDTKILSPAIERIKKNYGNISSVCTDRGFYSKENIKLLEDQKIRNAMYPRSIKQLRENLSDPIFMSLQTRRSQTEARIGIFKNVFLGRPLRTRKILYKRMAVTWCVLAHNLWVLARMTLTDEKSKQQKAA